MPGRVTICGRNSATGYETPVRVDGYQAALHVIDSRHARIHAGEFFSHTGKQSLTNGASFDHLLVTPAADAYVHLNVFGLDCSGAPIEHYLYEGATVSANGSVSTATNQNRLSATVPDLAIYHTPTVTGTGTQIHYELVPGAKQSGGIGRTEFNEWILASSTNYLSRVTNLSGGTITLGYELLWYEARTTPL